MEMNFNLTMSQEQKLVMTQQMQQSIKLLQMSSYDLRGYIEKEYAENPVLEANFNDVDNEEKKEQDRIDYKELIKYLEFDNYGSQSYGDYDDEVSPFTFISKEKSLKDFLEEQLIELNLTDRERILSKYIIESLNEKGYLDISLEEIQRELNEDIEELEIALQIVQGLEPIGIGARDLRECLLIQLRKKRLLNNITEGMVINNLEDIANNKYQVIAKSYKITTKEAQEYGDLIKKLEPKPARGFYTGDDVRFIIPDAEIKNIDGEFFIIMNNKVIPTISINPIYNTILNEKDKDAKEYVKEKMGKAMFLIKSIELRKSTLYKVLEEVLKVQRGFFECGKKELRPMTLKQVADAIGMHESTVSRAIREKYILTSFGTIKIKDLFATGVHKGNSNTEDEDVTVSKMKKEIEEIIKEENKSKPLSDQAIADILKEKSYKISRRTVAKYREEMGIGASSKRKRF
ncbi:RNA polymerase factor sigma-54 [Clostridium massiliamazoniense]|uniref:RNA polymerase factor sigma-54 n=1 Tax=Clostridium massiliamazoniense TaxID=1347366 RepID=UPI0006D84B1E|nr:RNA polymerase factor sigma-54 [Clostridium massiliamazoniense]